LLNWKVIKLRASSAAVETSEYSENRSQKTWRAAGQAQKDTRIIGERFGLGRQRVWSMLEIFDEME